MELSLAEKIELAVIVAAAVLWVILAPGHWEAPFGVVVGFSAALLLGQGFVRDVIRYVRQRPPGGSARRIVCLCAESSIGISLATVAVSLTLLGIDQPLRLGHAAVIAGPIAILAAGFFVKDYILVVRKEKDHANVRVW